jgi:hypothetical protein
MYFDKNKNSYHSISEFCKHDDSLIRLRWHFHFDGFTREHFFEFKSTQLFDFCEKEASIVGVAHHQEYCVD